MDIEKVEKNYKITISGKELDILQNIMIAINNNHAYNIVYQPTVNDIVEQIEKIKN